MIFNILPQGDLSLSLSLSCFTTLGAQSSLCHVNGPFRPKMLYRRAHVCAINRNTAPPKACTGALSKSVSVCLPCPTVRSKTTLSFCRSSTAAVYASHPLSLRSMYASHPLPSRSVYASHPLPLSRDTSMCGLPPGQLQQERSQNLDLSRVVHTEKAHADRARQEVDALTQTKQAVEASHR